MRSWLAAVVLQAASVLLDYPAGGTDLQLVQAAVDELPRGSSSLTLRRFLEWWRPLACAERESVYVETFDLCHNASLYLTEGRAGSPADRGATLLALRRGYEEAGLAVSRDELPDYLPLMLEVAAQGPACLPLLAAQRPAIDHLRASLGVLDSPFRYVLDAVLAVLPARPSDAPWDGLSGGSTFGRGDDEKSPPRTLKDMR